AARTGCRPAVRNPGRAASRARRLGLHAGKPASCKGDSMERVDTNRRAMLAGVGGVVVGTLIATRSRAQSPRQAAEMQAVLDKIARTDQGFGECCLPVQAFPGSGGAAFTLDQPGSY